MVLFFVLFSIALLFSSHIEDKYLFIAYVETKCFHKIFVQIILLG